MERNYTSRNVEPSSLENGQVSATDWEFMRRARRGEPAAFHELVDRHAGPLYGLAFRLLGNAADAEDVVQETLAGAFRGLRSFGERSSVKTWLTQILVRQVAKHRRSQPRFKAATLDGTQADRSAASAQGRADLRMDLSAAILALSPEHRQVIVLRELQGTSYDEMAEILGVPRGTVESRLFRARRQLQEFLRD